MFQIITLGHEIHLKICLKYINTEQVDEKAVVTAIWLKKNRGQGHLWPVEMQMN